MKLLLTGKPGVGKTTCVIRIAEQLPDRRKMGFFTREIRERGRRTGFEVATFDGVKRTLAHVQIRSSYRVGKYGVDLAALEEIVTHLENLPITPETVVLIDEIGKMESFSRRFRRWVEDVLNQADLLIATIALKGTPWMETLKKRPDVQLRMLTGSNRDRVCGEVLQRVRQATAEK